jgi:hypothetical protein
MSLSLTVSWVPGFEPKQDPFCNNCTVWNSVSCIPVYYSLCLSVLLSSVYSCKLSTSILGCFEPFLIVFQLSCLCLSQSISACQPIFHPAFICMRAFPVCACPWSACLNDKQNFGNFIPSCLHFYESIFLVYPCPFYWYYA